jgi:hypothetical protein
LGENGSPLEQVHTPLSPSHYGEAVHQAVEARAERLITKGLQGFGWTEQHLAARPKGHPAKLELARQLRAQTTMPREWIARRLKMGSRGHLTWLLQQHRASRPDHQQGCDQPTLPL